VAGHDAVHEVDERLELGRAPVAGPGQVVGDGIATRRISQAWIVPATSAAITWPPNQIAASGVTNGTLGHVDY
jgi:hypothetical protein